MAEGLTNADRLAALLVKMGAAAPEEIETGQWSGGKCPYVIMRNADGSRTITIDKNDALGRATGATTTEAIDALIAKYGV